MTKPTVFISYSHDSTEHRGQVLALSERLRSDGIATVIDQYLNGAPPEGWPRWMLNQLIAAQFVLVVCTPTYYRRFRGQEEPNKGKGADWEGAFITQALYDARSNSNKFVPVLFSAADEDHIPEPLRLTTHYLLNAEESYLALYDVLLNQAGVEPGPIGVLKVKARATAMPMTFGVGATAVPVATPARSPAVVIWREKLEFFLVEDALCADPAMKFRLKHLIEEARSKIQALAAS